jgi:hypothetical protein
MGLFRRPGKGQNDEGGGRDVSNKTSKTNKSNKSRRSRSNKSKSKKKRPINFNNSNMAQAGLSESQPLKGRKNDSNSSSPEVDKETTDKAQAVMKDHLSIMKDVVMKIRHEDGYAKGMYANCPRLQHLLDRNPDLRPVFEDPRLVRINFETVYKEAGGILPEDEEAEAEKRKNPSLIMRIATHPIFRFLKVLIFIKKIIGCIAGGGIAIVTSFWACCTDCCTDCCCEDAIEEVGEVEDLDDDDNEYGLEDTAQMDENQKALNTAADYMEDPEVQEQMQRLLDDPENLEDAIENDAELRALRDSNPLCAELMTDPETMRILVDPDNLRALGDAPQVIELDFSDPNGFDPADDFVDPEAGLLDEYGDGTETDYLDGSGSMDDMEGLEAYDADYDENDIKFVMDDDPQDLMDFDDDGDASIASDGFDDELMENTEHQVEEADAWGEELELEAAPPDLEVDVEAGADVEVGAEVEVEAGDAGADAAAEGGQQASTWEDDVEFEQQDVEAGGDQSNANAGKKGGQNKPQQKQQKSNETSKGGMSGIVASLGVAATDVIASQIVGEVFGTGMGDFLGGGGVGPDLGGVEAVADQADAVMNDDVAGIAEDAVDDVDEDKDDQKTAEREERRHSRVSINEDGRKNYIGVMGMSGAAAAATAAAGAHGLNAIDEDEFDDGLESCNSSEGEDEDDKFSDEGSSDNLEDDKKPESKMQKGGKKIFGALKNIASATVSTAKETVAGALLGDDLAELLVEKQEEMGESDSEEEGDDAKKKEDGEEKSKRRSFQDRLFRRQRDEESQKQLFDVDAELLESFRINDGEEFDPSFLQDDDEMEQYDPKFQSIQEEDEESSYDEGEAFLNESEDLEKGSGFFGRRR